MAILANRVKIKGQLSELFRTVIFAAQKSLTIILLLISLVLVFTNGRVISSTSLEVVGRFLEAGSLIFKGASSSFTFLENRLSFYKNLEAENTRLKLELSKLKDEHEQNYILRRENSTLTKLLNVKTNLKAPFITTKLLSISKTPFSSMAIIASGARDGVVVNDIVSSSLGLVGRVVETSDNFSSVMLIDDKNSRIPAITGSTGKRGILASQNDRLKLIYLKEKALPTVGEIIYSSGDGKIYPDGLKIGVITEVSPDGVFVQPIALENKEHSLDQDFVKVYYLNRELPKEKN